MFDAQGGQLTQHRDLFLTASQSLYFSAAVMGSAEPSTLTDFF